MTAVGDNEISIEIIDENLMRAIKAVQRARLDTRKKVTLAHIFRGRNADYLRSTRQASYQLVKTCLDMYLMSADETHFVNLSNHIATSSANGLKSAIAMKEVSALLASGNAPYHIEVLCASDQAENRLTKEFFASLCDLDAKVNWERMSQFIAECDRQRESAEPISK